MGNVLSNLNDAIDARWPPEPEPYIRKRRDKPRQKRDHNLRPITDTIEDPEMVKKRRSESREIRPGKIRRLDEPSTSLRIVNDKKVSRIPAEYNMEHEFRGDAVIFHYKAYKSCFSTNKTDRSEVKKLSQTLGQLGFQVTVYDDLTLQRMRDRITKLSKKTDHSKKDCLAIAVLTHEKECGRLCTKDSDYSVQELWKPFTSLECPSLAGKPKLFFIEVCKNGEETADQEMDCNGTAGLTNASDSGTYLVPSCADFLIVYSKMQGSTARDGCSSWFIESLCQQLEKQADSTDLLKIVTRISNHNSSDLSGNRYTRRQIPHLHSTLTRDLYLGW